MTIPEAKGLIKTVYPLRSITDIDACVHYADPSLLVHPLEPQRNEELFWQRVKEYMKRTSRNPYAIK